MQPSVIDTPRGSLPTGLGNGRLPARRVLSIMAPMRDAFPALICLSSARITRGWRSGFLAELSCEQSTMIDGMSPAALRSLSVRAIRAGEKLGPADPPPRTMGELGF